jgi:hypothetical protein
MKTSSPTLSAQERDALIQTLKARFEKYTKRHKGLTWASVLTRLDAAPAALWSLSEMERTGGEPDVIGHDKKSGSVLFVDCSAQSPKGRRSVCYDGEARKARKEHPPKSSAVEMAAAMGVELLTEEQYRGLQTLDDFDTTTSSWIATPAPIRKLGGAVFCDRRYNNVFLYHNGADSYYAARGFRGAVKV